jgi:hypothetical protein
MIRQHQFDKVELVQIAPVAAPTDAWSTSALTRHAESILKRSNCRIARWLLCTGDMGFSAAKTYDLEVWLPGQVHVSRDLLLLQFRSLPGAAHAGALAQPDKRQARTGAYLNGSGVPSAAR